MRYSAHAPARSGLTAHTVQHLRPWQPSPPVLLLFPPARHDRGQVSPVLFTSVRKSPMVLCSMQTLWADTGEAREPAQHEPVQDQVLYYLREPCTHTDPAQSPSSETLAFSFSQAPEAHTALGSLTQAPKVLAGIMLEAGNPVTQEKQNPCLQGPSRLYQETQRSDHAHNVCPPWRTLGGVQAVMVAWQEPGQRRRGWNIHEISQHIRA